ncbi:MAG: coproporphyrinogen-III oxidase family protein [Gemmatimonadota bacterium]
MTPTVARSVYVHAPFCARRCFYCDFAVQVRRVGDLGGWLSALAGELDAVARDGLFSLDEPLSTLYVGGGTPSLLGPDVMEKLKRLLGAQRLSDPSLEWTAEANPESLTSALAKAWRVAGVNRLSIGVQSFHGPSLRWMGRLHGPDGARASVDAARRAGIANLSVDLIFGLPGHLGRDWRSDLDATLALDVPHVSLYGLGVEEGTPLGRAVREGREAPVDDERYREEYLTAAECLAAEGYEQYEVSNFSRPGMQSRHNSVYWNGGVKEGVVTGGLGRPARQLVQGWVDRGLARTTGDGVCLTPGGWLLLDRLAVELDDASSG